MAAYIKFLFHTFEEPFSSSYGKRHIFYHIQLLLKIYSLKKNLFIKNLTKKIFVFCLK